MAAVDRDRAIEHLLHASAEDSLHAGGPECLDAETLAAWQDAGFDQAARRRIDDHLASCARCQAMAAALARADVLEEPAPASAPARRAASASAGRVAWARRWVIPPESRQPPPS